MLKCKCMLNFHLEKCKIFILIEEFVELVINCKVNYECCKSDVSTTGCVKLWLAT